MPVVEAWRDHQPVERPEAESHVGVDEDGEEGHEDEVGVERHRGEAQDVERHEREPAGHDDVDQVQTGSRQPVESLGRVVNGVQTPEPWHVMKGPVHPVLGEVGDEHDLHELQGQRLSRDCILEPRVRGPPKEHRGGQHREHDRHLHHQMAHREVHEVGRPALAEDRLIREAGDHALEGDEEQGQHEQVQQEPVEPHRGRSAESSHLGGGAAEQGARGGQRHPGEAEYLAAPQHHAQRAEAEAEDEHHVDQEADQIERVERARRGRGEPAREQEAQDPAVAERAAGDGEDPADPARAEAATRAPAEA